MKLAGRGSRGKVSRLAHPSCIPENAGTEYDAAREDTTHLTERQSYRPANACSN